MDAAVKKAEQGRCLGNADMKTSTAHSMHWRMESVTSCLQSVSKILWALGEFDNLKKLVVVGNVEDKRPQGRSRPVGAIKLERPNL